MSPAAGSERDWRRVALLVLLAGCQPPTQYLVDVDAEEGVRREARIFCARVTPGFPEEGRFQTELPAAIPEDVTWPTTVPIVPGASLSQRGIFTFEAAACRSGCNDCFVSTSFRRAFSPGELRRQSLLLTDQCVNVVCPEGTTCRGAGVCVDPVVPPGDEDEPSDVHPALCNGPLCYEHPRPGRFVFAACLDDEFALLTGDQGVLTDASGGWEREQETAADLRSAVCLGGGRALVAGQGGYLAERGSDGTWRELDVGAPSDASLVVRGGGDEVWLSSGAFLRRRAADGSWAEVVPPGSGTTVVVSPDGSHVWAIAGGLAYRWEGDGWGAPSAPLAIAPGETLEAATFTDRLEVGDSEGTLHRLAADGSWSVTARPCPAMDIHAMSGASDGQLVVGGGRGQLTRRGVAGDWHCATPLSGLLAPVTVALAPNPAGGLRGIAASDKGVIVRWTVEDGVENFARDGAYQFHGDLLDVAWIEGDRFVAVGNTIDGSTTEPLLIERIDADGHWRVRAIPDVRERLVRVAASTTRVVAVGEGGALLERDLTSAAGYLRVATGTTHTLSRVVTRDGRWLVAGGDVLLERGDAGWAPVTPAVPGGRSIRALAIDEGGNIWVGTGHLDGETECAGGPEILRLRDGGAWETVAPSRCPVRELVPRPGGGAWVLATGDTGHGIHRLGAAPGSTLVLLTPEELAPLDFGLDSDVAASRMWVVDDAVVAARLADEGTFHYRGSRITSAQHGPLRGFAARGDASVVMLVGDNSTVLQR